MCTTGFLNALVYFAIQNKTPAVILGKCKQITEVLVKRSHHSFTLMEAASHVSISVGVRVPHILLGYLPLVKDTIKMLMRNLPCIIGTLPEFSLMLS